MKRAPSSFAVAVLLVLGCDRFRSAPDAPPDPAPAASQVPSSSPSAEPPAPSGSAPAKVKLDRAVRRRMKLGMRRVPAADLAFGKGRFAVLGEDELVVRPLEHPEQTLRFPVGRPRALTALADGSLFVAAGGAALRLLPQDTKPLPVPRVMLLPRAVVFPDRSRPDRLWVTATGGKTLFGYDVVRGAAPLATPAEWVELDGFDERALVSVRDGSFVYTTPHGLVQFYGKGTKRPVDCGARDPLRLLPGSRPDTIWVVSGEGATVEQIIAGKCSHSKTVRFETTPYDAAAEDTLLAVLELRQPDDAPWGFVLEVFDVSGKRLSRIELPTEESLDEDWAEQLARDHGLALSATPPLVAVGGTTRVEVLDAKRGTPVFSAP